jgi:hypothetical protein
VTVPRRARRWPPRGSGAPRRCRTTRSWPMPRGRRRPCGRCPVPAARSALVGLGFGGYLAFLVGTSSPGRRAQPGPPARAPLAQGAARRDRSLGLPNRHLSRRALPPPRETARQAKSPGRYRPLHPGHHLPPPRRPRRTVPRPGIGAPRRAHQRRAQDPRLAATGRSLGPGGSRTRCGGRHRRAGRRAASRSGWRAWRRMPRCDRPGCRLPSRGPQGTGTARQGR